MQRIALTVLNMRVKTLSWRILESQFKTTYLGIII